MDTLTHPDVDRAGVALLGEFVARLGAHGDVLDAHPAVDAHDGLGREAGSISYTTNVEQNTLHR